VQKSPDIYGVSDFGLVSIPPKIPFTKGGCHRTLSDDGVHVDREDVLFRAIILRIASDRLVGHEPVRLPSRVSSLCFVYARMGPTRLSLPICITETAILCWLAAKPAVEPRLRFFVARIMESPFLGFSRPPRFKSRINRFNADRQIQIRHRPAIPPVTSVVASKQSYSRAYSLPQLSLRRSRRNHLELKSLRCFHEIVLIEYH
jgi:hypothetical protein